MKQRVLLIFTLFFISMSMFSQNKRNAYQAEWKEVDEFVKESLPKSALEAADAILKKATAEKNVPQIMKACIYQKSLSNKIDRDNNYDLLKALETLLTNTNSPADKALLHSVLAGKYMDHYSNNRWNINRRTNLGDDVPEDIKEWTSGIYENKIYEHLEASISHKDTLNKATTQEYTDIIQLGTDSRVYQPTLYDFVMNRTIETARSMRNIGNQEFDLSAVGVKAVDLLKPAKDYIALKLNTPKKYSALKYYQQYLADLQQRGLTSATVLMELQKFNYIKSLSNSLTKEERLEALYTLEKIYAVDETTVEIIDAITSELQNNNRYMGRRGYPIADDGNEGDKDIHKKTYTWLNKGIGKYPNYARMSILKNKLSELERPTLSVNGNNLFYNEEAVTLDIVHQNSQLVKKEKIAKLYRKENGKETLIKEYPINFSSETTYDADTTKLELGILPSGRYLIKSNYEVPKYQKESFDFGVSNLMSYSRNSAKNRYEIFVVDRKNGKPIKGATITLRKIKNSKAKTTPKVLGTLTTNELGFATYKDTLATSKNNYRHDIATYTVNSGADNGLHEHTLYSGSYNYKNNYKPSNEELNKNTISIFADRSIYRPAQIVYMKAIVIDRYSKVVANKKQKVKLYNPNGEVVSEKTLSTNEFGSIACEFVLPQGGLLGQHWITVEDNNHLYFRVEEYKRPTFEVKFDKIDKTFSFGDKITLKGNAKTFSGISLQDADVKYNIARRPFSFWSWGASNSSPFQDGTVKTKDDGTFEIEFTPEAGDGNNLWGRKIYTFEVTASVTDINGETQSNNFTISVGEVSMILNVQMPNKIEKSEEPKVEITAQNLNGVAIETSGTYAIYTLDKNDSIQTTLAEGSFKTGVQEELAKKIKTLPSGKLRIEVKGNDSNNREVKSHTDFILYAYNDTKPPYETNAWLVEKETTFKENKPVEVIFGTSNKDAYILYQIHNNTKVFERKFVKLNNENKTFNVPYTEAYGEEVVLSLTIITDGKLESQNISLKKEKIAEDNKLNIKLDVFRDKLRPGQAESWTMSIRNSKGDLVSAEVLASMYDISLDQIAPLAQWALSRPYVYKEYIQQLYYNYSTVGREHLPIDLKYDRPSFGVKWFDFDSFRFSDFLKFYYSSDLSEVVVAGYGTQARKQLTGAVPNLSTADTKNEILLDVELSEQKVILADGGAAPAPMPEQEPQIRRNFNETAFFFPQLKTNEKGETLVAFTVPESNTTWRFRALAHDKDSKVGTLEKMVVTRKELMITPNMPRFLRHGDKTSISTKVSNLSENAIGGDVRIEFFNPIDEKAIDLGIKDAKQAFDLEKDASSSATWTFDVPTDIDMIGVRIVAQSESFSDGEQHALAVLPNRMLVTETMPVDITEVGEQVYTLDKLANNKSNTLENYKLTFEFASNPAWYAVQALPTMSNPTNENAVEWFASYYTNTLGASLMRQYPKVANVIEAWRKQGASKETLVSKLSKNEELKTILLEETPWVMDAKSETEQMERLSLLFDLNNTKHQTATALKKLQDLQTDTGGWSWYKGMYPSRSVTQYILYSFANLQNIGMVEYPEEVKVMQMNALKYVDLKMVEDFENLKKWNKDWKNSKFIATSQLEYIYLRAMYSDIPLSHKANDARKFYTEVVSKNWTSLGLYEKSLLATYLSHFGDKALASKVTQSIKEHSVEKKELGMYWPNNSNRVFLSMSAVSTHTFMMEAMKANGATTSEMDMMKRWLVKQKQTQIWESTHATIDAISALLKDGSDWLSSDAAPTIKVGKELMVPENKDLGTGYFKTSWSKGEIKNDMAKVTLNSADSKPAYGSLYWQYYEDLDKITKQGGALNVNKELYKEVVNSEGKSLMKITESNPLNVGDKVVVRLVVRSDRDMEFVQLKDMRASCFEPVNTVSGIAWQNSAPYYQATKDASTNFFFDVLPKGTYVFEYAVYVNRIGEYSNGITSIQCAYAPAFTSHTAGTKVTVK